VVAAASQVLRSVLFGISPLDPIAFAGAALCLIVVAFAAITVPLRNAQSRSDDHAPLRVVE
jgi:hypothetical protein